MADNVVDCAESYRKRSYDCKRRDAFLHRLCLNKDLLLRFRGYLQVANPIFEGSELLG